MRPVNLAPGKATTVAVKAEKPNFGMIGGAIAGVLVMAAVAGYFGMARVDAVKAEAQASRDAASSATSETQSVKAQVQSLGQPVKDTDRNLAQGQEAIVVAAFTERHDFVQLAEELRGIMQGTGGWYEKVTASVGGSGNSGGTHSVTISGVMPSNVLAASFDERINATRSLENADLETLKSVELVKVGSKSRRSTTYWQFTIGADLVDTKAPFVSGSSGSAGDSSGTAVGDSGAGESASLELSLEAKPKVDATKDVAKQNAKPRNPFDIAASNASGGGS